MIQPDITPAPDEPVWWIMVQGNQVAVHSQFQNPLVPLQSAGGWPEAEKAYTAKIGSYRGVDVFLLIASETTALPEGYTWLKLRDLLMHADQELFALAGRACQVVYFLKTHRYCGTCGDQMVQDRDELAVICPTCNFQCYPRISPCIIVAVYRKNEILLARGSRHPEGLYSVLAGFVESGESFEQCLHREVFEETGVSVKTPEYLFSQPWPFPHSLMAGFVAEFEQGEIAIDGKEILDAQWFSLDSLPQTPPKGTIAARLIDHIRALDQ